MSVFFTGFPGFLGSALVERLLERDGVDAVTCLVQSKYRDVAAERAEALTAAADGDDGDADGNADVELVVGDITDPDLGLGTAYDDVAADVEEIYHLAAVYDLGVERDVGMRVNLDGTRHVLDFAESCPSLSRVHYVSTCYVSGRHDGVFGEDDFDVGQSFNNHYEETKFLAERAVRRRMREGLPVTVYRPAIAVGDSETGATQKYDGPYYVLRYLRRCPGVAVVPVVGDPRATEVNVVPRNFVVDAIDELSGRADTVGETYHLSDPNPPTVAELLSTLSAATGTRVLRVPVPRGTLTPAMSLPGIERLTGIDPAVVDYFSHPTRYTCAKTVRALRGTGVSCPPFASYADTLAAFVRAHPDLSDEAMV